MQLNIITDAESVSAISGVWIIITVSGHYKYSDDRISAQVTFSVIHKI